MRTTFKYLFGFLLLFLLTDSKLHAYEAYTNEKVHVLNARKYWSGIHKNSVDRNQDYDLRFKRRYKPKCREVNVLHVSSAAFTRDYTFRDIFLPKQEDSVFLSLSFSRHKRGPPQLI